MVVILFETLGKILKATWTIPPHFTNKIDLHNCIFSSVTHKGGGHYEALVSGLLPHSAYMLRAAAYSQLGASDYTDPLVLKTQEEGCYTVD